LLATRTRGKQGCLPYDGRSPEITITGSSPVAATKWRGYNARSLPIREVSALVFVAFLAPLGLYLLVLGWLNRQPRPVLVPGTWDFVGVMFAASGFLLVGGPAVLSSFSEGWRSFWVMGEVGSVVEGLAAVRRDELLVGSLYFVLVVLTCGFTLAGRRGSTAIYNVEPGVVEAEVEAASAALGLRPARSGAVFVFGLEGGPEKTVLHVETFAAMRHVTLRWDAAASPLRAAVEAELDRRLDRVGPAYHETGSWLTLAGAGLLGLSALTLFALALRVLYLR
jgi:hypothetical protein